MWEVVLEVLCAGHAEYPFREYKLGNLTVYLTIYDMHAIVRLVGAGMDRTWHKYDVY